LDYDPKGFKSQRAGSVAERLPDWPVDRLGSLRYREESYTQGDSSVTSVENL